MSASAEHPEQDIEFLPSDEIDEPELTNAEDDAVHTRESDEPRGLMATDGEDFDADQLDEDEVDELEIEADEAAAAGGSEDDLEEEHEEDLQEILSAHYGIVSAEPEEDLARRPTVAAEFVCRACFLRKPTTQLADAGHSLCVDCTADGA